MKRFRFHLRFLLLVVTSTMCHGQDYEGELARLEDKAFEYFYSNKDSTYYYFDRINELALKHGQVPTAIDNLNYVCFAAGYFYDLEKIKSTIEEAQLLVDRYAKVLDTLPDQGAFQKNYLNFNKGNYFHKLQDYEKAKFYFDDIARQLVSDTSALTNEEDIELLSQCYNFIAQMNVQQSRYHIANEYYEKNIRLYKKSLPDDLEGLHKIYNLYANSLYAQKDFERAKTLWINSLSFLEKNFNVRNRNSLVTTGLLVANVFKDLNQIDSAYAYLEKIKPYRTADDPFEDRFLAAEGELLMKQKAHEKALSLFNEALSTTLENNRPNIHMRIGELHLIRNDPKKALRSYQSGLDELVTEPQDASNPDPSLVKRKNMLFSLLCGKVQALSALSDTITHDQVLHTLDSGLKTLDLLKPSFKNNVDKLELIAEAFALFETGLNTAYSLAQLPGGEKYIDLAFTYAEKSKSILLLEALLSAKANQFANVPDALLQHELQLKSEITFYEKKVNDSEDDSTTLKDQLFSLREAHRRIIDSMETHYRSYYDLKYNTETRTLNSMQKFLGPDEQLISYFYGNDAIFIIGIDADTKRIHKVPLNPSLENTIQTTYRSLVDPNSNIMDLGQMSNQLFQQLVSPLLAPGLKKRLIIIPDGLLNYIPFGALNTAENGLSYLMEDYNISYVNSATLHEQLTNRGQMEGELLAFAPKFSGELTEVNPNRDTLLPLPHNKREVARILTSFKGRSYVDEEATLHNFTDQLANFSTLHLATHAVFDDNAPEYSYLAFSTASGEDHLLYVKDLYNLQLNSNLVTLSACETGVGELKKGEGFLSLARGFFYSGATCITSTLWKINDASTANIMDSFYKNLAAGTAKDEALAKAKTVFLEKNRENALAHPYYWSGFIVSGNTAALASNGAQQYIVWGIAALIAIFGGFLFLRKRRLL